MLFRLEIPVSKKLSIVIVGVKQFNPEEEGATILRNVLNLSPNDRAYYLGRLEHRLLLGHEVSNPLVLKIIQYSI